jgi:hypothetical protein
VRFALFRTYEELRALAAKIATERLALGPAPTMAQRTLAQYHAAYRDLQAVLLGVADAEATLAPAVGEWPVQQIVAHVIGAEMGFYGAIKYALDRHRSGDERTAEIPSEAWEQLIDMDEATYEAMMNSPLQELKSIHRTFHGRVLETFSKISDAELALPSVYWEGYELSLRFRLHRFDSHLRQHTVQLEKTLSLIGYPLKEAKDLVRLILAALAEAEGAIIGARDTGWELCQDAADTISARGAEIAGILAQ